MPLTSMATNLMADAIIGGSGYNKFTNASAYIGVGNGSDSFDPSEQDLQGASKTRKAMDASYPSRTENIVTFRSTFGTGDANFAWEEWGVFNASAAGQMLNRAVTSLGTKAPSATWQLTVTLTFALV